jgi:hypothetical protein
VGSKSSRNQTDLTRKEANLTAAIEKMLPDFARACRAPDTPVVMIMHQDAFAADYQEEEYRLIGMAIRVRWHLRQGSPNHRDEQADC